MSAAMAREVRGRVDLRDTRAVLLVPRLSILLLIATVAGSSNRVLFGLAVAAVMFGFDRASRNGWAWLTIGVIATAWNLLDWHHIDDHIVLAGYWYLALGAALLANDPERRLEINARLLIGVTFTVAVIRKLVSVEFVSGDFFLFTLLADPRFEPVATMIGGAADTSPNRMVLEQLPTPGVFASGDGVAAVALALTWGAVLVESAVAVFNLLPAARWRRAGQAALGVFVTTTYLIVPVAAFGATLATLGAASVGSAKGRVWWTGAFVVVLLWGQLWKALVL